MSIRQPILSLSGRLKWLLGSLHPLSAKPSEVPPIPSAEIEKAAARAARYLHQQIRNDGSFGYRINAFTGIEDFRRYNVLRHAGSMLALAQHARTTQLCAGDVHRLSSSGHFLVAHCVRAPRGHDDLQAVWSDPELTGGPRRQPVAKLGGTGLALAALIELESLGNEAGESALTQVLPIDRLRALGKFLKFMQRPDGSFLSLFNGKTRPEKESWSSLYYPGEAALGLIALHKRDPAGDWLKAAIEALSYLAHSRSGQAPPPDHWALIATERLFACSEDDLQSSVREPNSWHSGTVGTGVRDLLLRHAETVVETILEEQSQAPKGGCPRGWFGPEPRIAPTATRLEGLLAASRLPLHPHWKAQLPTAITFGLHFLLDSQLRAGPAAGGFTRTHLRGARKDDRRAAEVRIDYVQHALAAFNSSAYLTR